jgi:predicted RNase H-like HicB family nuclease
MRTLTADIQVDPETGLYFGVFPGIPGAHTQAKTLDELRHNLKEVLQRGLEESPEALENLPGFIGIQQITIED